MGLRNDSMLKRRRLTLLGKLQREILRVAQRTTAHYEKNRQKRFQRNWDKIWPTQVKIIDGSQSTLKTKVLLFLIYQPQSLPNSMFETLKYFEKNGYSILLISNHDINDICLQKLKEYSWKICVRPNYGYDFGGYRDGLNCWKVNRNP